MTKLEMIREDLREKISMDATDIYIDFRDAKDKKEMVKILCDQNLRLSREEMLDVLEDLGFKVGKMRRKPMDPAAKEKWHRDHPNNGGRKKKTGTVVTPVTTITLEMPGEKQMQEMIKQEIATKPLVITQEMLDVVNELMTKKLEVTKLLDRIDELSKQAASFGIIVEVPL